MPTLTDGQFFIQPDGTKLHYLDEIDRIKQNLPKLDSLALINARISLQQILAERTNTQYYPLKSLGMIDAVTDHAEELLDNVNVKITEIQRLVGDIHQQLRENLARWGI